MFLWRKKQNYPLIITKYPSDLFHSTFDLLFINGGGGLHMCTLGITFFFWQGAGLETYAQCTVLVLCTFAWARLKLWFFIIIKVDKTREVTQYHNWPYCILSITIISWQQASLKTYTHFFVHLIEHVLNLQHFFIERVDNAWDIPYSPQ